MVQLPRRREQHFSVLVAEGRPEGAGFRAASVLANAGVPVTVVLDSAVGYHMEVADLCLTGAEGVLENGGILNKARAGSGHGAGVDGSFWRHRFRAGTRDRRGLRGFASESPGCSKSSLPVDSAV